MIQAKNSKCPDSLGDLGANGAGTGLKSDVWLTQSLFGDCSRDLEALCAKAGGENGDC